MTVLEKINPQLLVLARPIAELQLDPENARGHSDRDVQAIARSLEEYGQQKPIVVGKDGLVRAGNGTLQAAQRLGWSKLAAVVFDGPLERAKRYAIADNRTAELSFWLDDVLSEQLQALQTDPDFDPESIGFTDAEAMEVIAAAEAAIEEARTVAERTGANAASRAPTGSEQVRQVPLLMTAAAHEIFAVQVAELGAIFKTATVADTVLKAVAEMHGLLAERLQREGANGSE